MHLVSHFNLGASATLGAVALLTIAGLIVVYIVDGCLSPGTHCGGSFTVVIVSAVSALVCMVGQAVLSMHVIRCEPRLACTGRLLVD